jgi:hypothetical protein
MMIDYEKIYEERAEEYDRLVSAEDCDGRLLPALEGVLPLAGHHAIAHLGRGARRRLRSIRGHASRGAP